MADNPRSPRRSNSTNQAIIRNAQNMQLGRRASLRPPSITGPSTISPRAAMLRSASSGILAHSASGRSDQGPTFSERLVRLQHLIARFKARMAIALDRLPIVVFYKYLYENNRSLLLRGIFVNYVLPILLEMLPFWWLSSRKLGISLYKTRIKLNHQMATGTPFIPRVVLNFLWLTIFHALLDTFKRHAANRVAIENRLLIRRLVFERLLYSEMGAFEKLRTLDVEYRISADISQTLNFFSFTLPQMVASLYALSREGFELYRNRQYVDPLALAYPVVVGIARKLMSYVKYHFIEKKQRDVISKTRTKMSRLVSNALDGISDIQVNNLQPQQLKELDKHIQTELTNSLGFKSLFYNSWNLFSHRNVLEFVAELFVVNKVMQRQKISHERYSKIQHDINRVIELAQRVYGLVRITRNMLEFQQEVVELVNIPNFLNEQFQLTAQLGNFRELKVSNMFFSYKEHEQPALDFYGTLTFEPGKRYALIGQNRSGKSTLCKLITKMYQPQMGTITLNGISYHRISRVALRDYISYLSQKPYLFPGTIRDNIRIGNPFATDEQVYAAAEAAGVFTYGIHDDFMTSRPGPEPKSPTFMRRSMSLNDMASHASNITPLSKMNPITPTLTPSKPPSSPQTARRSTLASSSENTGSPKFSTNRLETIREGKTLPPRNSGFTASNPSIPASLNTSNDPSLRRVVSGSIAQDRRKTKKNFDDEPAEAGNLEEMEGAMPLGENDGSFDDLTDEDEDERKPLLRRVLSFVWEAETDYNSYYSRKKEKKKKRKEKEKKRRRERKMSLMQNGDATTDSGENIRKSGERGEKEGKGEGGHGSSILDMKLTSRGGNISGGFAQSVALARVFVRTDAKIIILDEALGQMDACKKRDIIFPALMRFVKKWNMTLIFISHDMPSVQGMDVICVFHKGKLVHQGSHQQLVEEKAQAYLNLIDAESAVLW